MSEPVSQAAKKLLMLCYHYPPALSGGVERSARFARHLPSFGWEPVVFTTTRYGRGGGRYGERVVRVGELFAGRSSAPASRRDAAAPRDSRSAAGPLIRSIEKWILVPDRHIRWVFRAIRPALRIMRSERIDAIYSTSPPESAHLLACALKHFTGAPWIMDLRDPWTLEPLRWYLREGGARLALERRIESYAFGRADAIIVNTEEAAAAYRERYPGAAGRISTITNGWDAADFAAARAGSVVLRGEGDRGGAMYVAADRPDGGDRTAEETSAGEGRSRRFIVSHVGTFSRHVDEPAWPRAFFEAVRRLLDAGILSTRTFRVVLAGGMHPAAEREIDRLGLGSVLDRRGRVPHEEALRIMVRSDLLLLFDPSPEARYFIRGKLYEYLAAGAWILGLVQHGASRRLLERSGQAVILSPEDSGGIESVLARFVAERSRPARSGVFELEAFESASLTAALARVLGNAIRKGG